MLTIPGTEKWQNKCTPGIRALDSARQSEALALGRAGHDAHGDAGRAVAHRDLVAAKLSGSQQEQLLAKRVGQVLPSRRIVYCLHPQRGPRH